MNMKKRSVRISNSGLALSLIAWIGAGIPLMLLLALLSGVAGGILGTYLVFSKDLPDIPDLRAYRPKTVSTFYADDGSVIGLFYKEKRFPISVDSLPPHVLNAFLAAEDARFFSHPGVDPIGVGRAVVKNLKVGNYAQGASTITQQVTRNFILSREKKFSRKIREALLAFRLEKTLSKKEILGLYLNEIYLGRGAYGIEAASAVYFGKKSTELTIPEAALIAGLVSNPTKNAPPKNMEGALKRREFVLTSMLRNNFITSEECNSGMVEVPKFRENLPTPAERTPYFTEAARQYILEKYGAQKLYDDGLQVWTTCDIRLQERAAESLLKGAQAWERRQNRPLGLVKRLKPIEVKDFLNAEPLAEPTIGSYVQAVVLETPKQAKKSKDKKHEVLSTSHRLAFQGGLYFNIDLEGGQAFRVNDVVEFKVVESSDGNVSLLQVKSPAVQGAVVCIENTTGFVRALVGGLDFEKSSFNRATQAHRQPGSAFKPIVFASALEWGAYSPRTMVYDEPIAVVIDPREPEWMPSNSDGGFLGPVDLKRSLAQSRNIVAVKLVMDVGPDAVIKMARNMGFQTAMGPNLSIGLGSSEVTPLELTSAYSVFPNMGARIPPKLVKKVVDRFGKTLEDNTQPSELLKTFTVERNLRGNKSEIVVTGSNSTEQMSHNYLDQRLIASMRALEVASQSSGRSEDLQYRKSPNSALITHGLGAVQAMSPQTAYLMLSMMRETCVSGTASAAAKLKRIDLGGKTGTTDDCADAWFVGYNGKYTTGVWLGFDTKTSLGKQEYGGTAALPIWMDFMAEALRNEPLTAFAPPEGVVFWEANAKPGPDNVERLFEFGPDIDPSFNPKQNCPIDSTYFVATGYQDAYGPDMMNFGMQSMNHPGSLRILSPEGQTLGYGYPFRDETGRASLYKEPAYAQTQDYYQGFMPNQGNYYGRQNPYSQTMPGGSMRPDPRNPYYQRNNEGYDAFE